MCVGRWLDGMQKKREIGKMRDLDHMCVMDKEG